MLRANDGMRSFSHSAPGITWKFLSRPRCIFEPRVDVQHRSVPNVGCLADVHLVVVGADHDAEPDIDIVLEDDRAYQRGVVGDEMVIAAQVYF